MTLSPFLPARPFCPFPAAHLGGGSGSRLFPIREGVR